MGLIFRILKFLILAIIAGGLAILSEDNFVRYTMVFVVFMSLIFLTAGSMVPEN